jgi:HAD superfamily phosphatase (TIGR01668 family)
MPLMMPTYVIDKVTYIKAELLHRMGVRAILLDVDNTLSKPGSQVPYPGTVEWVREVRHQGFRLMIISNNFRARVAPFAAQYGLPFVSFAMKPLPLAYWRALHQLCVSRREAVVVGDQVFTDVLGANLVGIQSILLTPVAREGGASFRWRRSMEEKVRRQARAAGRYIDLKE